VYVAVCVDRRTSDLYGVNVCGALCVLKCMGVWQCVRCSVCGSEDIRPEWKYCVCCSVCVAVCACVCCSVGVAVCVDQRTSDTYGGSVCVALILLSVCVVQGVYCRVCGPGLVKIACTMACIPFVGSQSARYLLRKNPISAGLFCKRNLAF